ncbi:MAG: hypothetical protein MJ236_03035 [Clostridia bacterium]|nr:hypothetical protein [Clostridia bacterium]
MSEKNGMVFRNAIGGYNKSDVNTYLAAVAAEAKSKEEMSEMQISHLENDLADLKNENAVLSSKADELAIEAFSAETKLKEETTKREELERLLNEANEKIASLEAELEEEKSKDCTEEELNTLRDKYKEAANDYYEEVMMFVGEVKNYLEGFAREISNRSMELSNRIEYMLVSDKPKVEELTGEFVDKTEEENVPEKVEKEEKKEEKAPKKRASETFDEKVEHFFRSTMAAINAFKRTK